MATLREKMAELEQYTVAELKVMPTLHSGHFANLKVDSTDGLRWWLTRCSQADGEKYPISVEQLVNGSWTTVHEYGSWEEWADDEEEEAEEEPESEVEEGDEPQEGDYTSPDHCKWYQYGKLVLELTPDDDHCEALKAHMEKEKFFPNAFFISDHGNAHRIDLS